MQATIEEAVNTIVASGGTIDSNALLGFAKTAGGMGRVTTDMPTLFDNVMTAIIVWAAIAQVSEWPRSVVSSSAAK